MGAESEVLLGMGGCVDHEVRWDAAVIEKLVREHRISAAELSEPGHPGEGGSVHGEREMLLVLLSQLVRGSGSERFVDEPTALLTFSRRFPVRKSLGGSSVRAAVALDRLGLSSTLHLVSIDDDVRRLLPRSATYMCSARLDSTHPHVIVQYPAGARVRVGEEVLEAPQANRLIFVNDPPNSELRIAPEFGLAVSAARVIVISGFNTMAGLEAVGERAGQVREHLAGRTPGAVVVYEDAGFHHDDQREVVLRTLRDGVDIWSMNEDEAQHYLGRELDLLDPAQVVTAVDELHDLVTVPTLVLHTRYWALAHGPRDLRAALALGISTASARYVHGDDWQPTERDAIAGMSATGEAERAAADIEAGLGSTAVAAVPGLEVAEPTTIGLGDTFLGGLVAGLVQS
ncbi:ADP-dependent glucokinase/phosphofructokinase [Ruania zhangjianzhongii]|uniref:ADP-dependent glucokinase/phosphofructokinase n=1 Tax=Ruania zhangjianzhongii TaxID=2603206 RepID=UPI0011C7A64A|nr:ADP-dependent glucokinase/phosphofructokinase [Ruania zhangjianzhongii]